MKSSSDEFSSSGGLEGEEGIRLKSPAFARPLTEPASSTARSKSTTAAFVKQPMRVSALSLEWNHERAALTVREEDFTTPAQSPRTTITPVDMLGMAVEPAAPARKPWRR